MKLHFEPDLDYQHTAIAAVANLFHGQEINRTEFTVTRRPADHSGQSTLDLDAFTGGQGELGLVENELGVGNRLTLLDDEILANLKDIQLRNGLAPSTSLASGDFTVEMETGTGKTYVYLRTVFELNKLYGFTKFVIVVPSIAIKEGVYKTLKITEAHFKGLYAGQPYDYFLYDSAKLGQVRSYATSPNIQIMVLTVGAINKFGDESEARTQDAGDRPSGNVMYRPHEKTGGERPIDLVRATNPIVIIDEPQTVDGGLTGQGRQAQELDALIGPKIFNNPKPTKMLLHLLRIGAKEKDSIVMDFFSGSGSTGHAVMKLNAEDGGSRRYLLVQLPEFTERSDLPTISAIGRHRLKKASDELAPSTGSSLDTGYRAFTLSTSNIRAWEPVAAEIETTLLSNAEHLVQGRTEQDILYELLLKLGLDLCVPIETKQLEGKTVYSVGGGALIVCLGDGLTKDVVEKLAQGIVAWRAKLAPAVDTRLVFKDSGFADDIAKTNMAAILNQNGIADIRSL